MQGGVSAAFEAVLLGGAPEQGGEVGLEVVEVGQPLRLAAPLLGQGRAGHQAGDVLGFAGAACAVRGVSSAAFEQAGALALALAVVLPGGDETAPQGGAHHRHGLGDGVVQGHRRHAGVELLLQLRVDKAVGHHFLVAARHQAVLEGVQRPLRLRHRERRQRGGIGTRRDALVAVEAADFLHQVRFDAQVVAVGGDTGAPGAGFLRLGLDAEAAQQGRHFAGRDGAAEQALDAAVAQAHGGGVLRCTAGFDDGPGLAAADLLDQGGGALQRAALQGRVDAALEAVARIRQQLVAAAAGGHGHRVEAGGLEEDLGGRFAHAGGGTAHHAGQHQRAAVVGDEQVGRGE